MIKFNEWITKSHPEAADGLAHGDGMQTKEDVSLVATQLHMMVDRVAGLLHHVSEGNRPALIDNFVNELKSRL